MGRKNKADGAPDTGPASTDVVEEGADGVVGISDGVPPAPEAPPTADGLAPLPPEAAPAPPTLGDPPPVADPAGDLAAELAAERAEYDADHADELACAGCTKEVVEGHGLRVMRPCLKHFVAAGYTEDKYQVMFPPLPTPPKPKATQSGHTICKVTGTAVMYRGKFVEENTVDEFADEIVLAHPAIFISQED